MNIVEQNLVEQIKHQVTDGSLAQLSSLIGASEGETQSAVGAAVPAVLSSLSGMASGSGAQKLASALSHFETGSPGHVSHMLSSQPSAVLEQGNSILNALFGGSTVSGIVSALSRYTGMGSGSGQKLLGYLMPMVLGAIAGRFTGKGVNAQGLASLLADQKANISAALPSGFSLADVPGVGATREATREAARTVSEAAKPAAESIWKWLLPVLAIGAMAVLLLWYFTRTPAPKVPDFAQVNTDLTGTFKSLTESLNGIKDATTAETALPKLKELDGKLDAMKAQIEKLPDAEKHKVTELIKADVGKVEDQFAKLLWIPGVGDKIRAPLDGIMGKLTALAGLPASKVSQVSADMAGTFSSLTATLPGIKDSESAEAALPKLRDISDKLDGAKSALDGLSEGTRATILAQVKLALGKLKEIADKVMALAGVGDKIKPVLAAIMGKLNTLVA
jgi:hypothetical protein